MRPEFKIWHHLSRLTISSLSSECKCHNKVSCLLQELVEKLWGNIFHMLFNCFSNAFPMANFAFMRNFLDLKMVLMASTLEHGNIHLVYY